MSPFWFFPKLILSPFSISNQGQNQKSQILSITYFLFGFKYLIWPLQNRIPIFERILTGEFELRISFIISGLKKTSNNNRKADSWKSGNFLWFLNVFSKLNVQNQTQRGLISEQIWLNLSSQTQPYSVDSAHITFTCDYMWSESTRYDWLWPNNKML